jgi:hypothetical protein
MEMTTLIEYGAAFANNWAEVFGTMSYIYV